ncbi:type II toxin-antitoxin system HipA family toxin [Methylocapsa sp. D3K7]|uniref:type II toxin-antitoxin system HipA family toxin n=1 Tax=Methylocapsa sp. D3K7 TaxID=3041435 RepID=UPI00244EB682|nr:type II toxin-antitoxin system HipA family toxin [Methylocapsa sp. D3K7]WGJ13884.1 type II toxin-antitoxin system HipA family toxin [Methylocapsa sp. D3K7]
MALHLVGETIDKTRSHYQAETGKLVQLMRGIYVDAGDDADATVLRHAIRIAKYLYPRAYLSGASAVLLAPTRDGRLFLSGRRIQRTRIRTLEIIQNEAPKHPSIGSAVIDEGMGEFHINVSSIRQRFLEGFRLRSEHAASIDEDMRDAIALRLVEEYGSPKAAADALWALARENEWYREGELAERFLLHRPAVAPAKNQAALDLIVAWHGKPVGHLRHDGFEWRWNPIEDGGPPLIRQTTPGKLPPFIVSLLPEGWLETVLKDKDERALLRSGRRYMSNITIVEQQNELAALPPDVLLTRLEQFTTDGTFTGRYAGPGRSDIEESFERNLAQIYESADTPRLSGVQIKAPMYLDAGGALSPSTSNPFTHILKPAGTSGYDALPMIEWLDMALGRAAGFATPATALVAMPDGMPPALIVERFDIRESLDDSRMLALEDFCSVLELPTQDKYKGTMERVARAIRPLSTAPEEDLLIVLKRALFAWLIADGDMHLKNMALLKIAEPGEQKFRSVRIAPLYDAVTTRVFPRLKHDHLALKLNGKDDRLRRADFRAFAATAGLKAGDADAAIDQMLGQMKEAIDRIALPKALDYEAEHEKMALQLFDICRSRIESFA